MGIAKEKLVLKIVEFIREISFGKRDLGNREHGLVTQGINVIGREFIKVQFKGNEENMASWNRSNLRVWVV